MGPTNFLSGKVEGQRYFVSKLFFFFSLNPWFFFFKIDNGHIEKKEDIKALEVKYMNTFAESISRVFTRMEQSVLEHCFNNRPHIYTGGGECAS
jgi:ketopantoate reductase